jgi:hypothetical protein
MSICRKPGVLCCFRDDESLDDGTLYRGFSPLPGIRLQASPLAETVSEEDKAEFKLLQKHVGVLNKKGKSYPDAAAYVKDRNAFFGSEAEYRLFAAESDTELEDTEWKIGKRTVKLRQLIEIGKHPEAQDIFYRWVRKAYFLKLGDDVDVPELIKKGMTPKLAEALRKVRTSYKKSFKAGGFNPRPIKLLGKYRLGTLSEHGLGAATDIDHGANAQIKKGDWDFVEKLTAKKIDRSLSRWKKEPEKLWQDVKDINDAFVKKVAEETKRIADERAKKPKPAPADPKKAAPAAKKESNDDPVDEVLAGHMALKRWRGGFFTLEWELVHELHSLGFTWGATFPDVDLHHFELS